MPRVRIAVTYAPLASFLDLGRGPLTLPSDGRVMRLRRVGHPPRQIISVTVSPRDRSARRSREVRVRIQVLDYLTPRPGSRLMSSMPWGDRAGWRKVSRLESSTWIRWPLICHFSLSDTPPNPLGDRLAQHLTVTIEQVDPPCPSSHTG